MSLILGVLGLVVGLLAWKYPHFWDQGGQGPSVRISFSAPPKEWSPATIGLFVAGLGMPIGLLARGSHRDSAKASYLFAAVLGAISAFVFLSIAWVASSILGSIPQAWACAIAWLMAVWFVRGYVMFVALLSVMHEDEASVDST